MAVSGSTLMAKSSNLKKMSNDQYSSNYDLNPALLWRRAAQAERRESRFENLTSFFHFLIKDAHNTTNIFFQAMEEDEVVNCLCHHPEGDGMMVQVVSLQELESGSITFRN